MTPKEKAIELIDKYINLYPSYIVMFQGDFDKAKKDIKQGALIAVDEILKVAFYATDEIYNHYLEVKQEIEKL